MPAYYGRARRDYEPDVVYVEPRRRSYDYDDDRRAPRESERERELQDLSLIHISEPTRH